MDNPWRHRLLDGELVQAAYTAARLKRAPRAFIVLGERIGIGWPVLGAAVLLAIAAATAAEERAADRERHELRARADHATELASRAISDVLTCEAVLATCVEVLDHGGACACWLDGDDGAEP